MKIHLTQFLKQLKEFEEGWELQVGSSQLLEVWEQVDRDCQDAAALLKD
jgi:hypothetical protein